MTTLNENLVSDDNLSDGPSRNDGLWLSNVCVERGRTTVLSNISCQAPGGAITALIGPNGAGKSTVIGATLGLIPVLSGEIRLHGVDVLHMDRLERARSFGYVPQRSALQAPMTVTQVVAMGRYAHGGSWFSPPSAAINDALDMVDAKALGQRPFNELSAGEAQRVLIARALAGGARTLLLDEPTASLDIGHALGVLSLLQRLKRSGHTIVIALHQLDDVRRIADHAVLLHRGQVLASNVPEQLLNSDALTEAFGVVCDGNQALSFRPQEEPS